MRNVGCNILVTVLLIALISASAVLAEPNEPPSGRGRGPWYRPDGPGAGRPYGRMWRGAVEAPVWRPGSGQNTIFQLIGRRLDLTDEQREQIRQIRQTRREEQQKARQAVADARKAMQEAVAANAESEEIRKAANALGTAIGEQAIQRVNTLKAVKQILTDEQREELEKIRQQAQQFRERAAAGPLGPEGHAQRARRGPGMFGERFRPGRGRGPGEWGGAQGRRPRVGRGPNIDRFFENRDADDDGRLTEEELHNPGRNRPMLLERIFDEADTDSDGALTADELKAWKDKTAQTRGPRYQR